MTTIDPGSYKPSPDILRGKVILVTGAGDGIGHTAAVTLAAHGATVILLGKTLDKLAAVYDEIVAGGSPEPLILSFNLQYATPDDFANLAHSIESNIGKLDGILHNAAVLGQLTSVANYNPDTWLQVMQVNANAPFMLTHALFPLLQASNDASVVFTTSSVGRKGRAFWGAYAVSKFAIEGLMQVLAEEQAGINQIRFNCINPGATRTKMRAAAYPAENPATVKTAAAIMPYYLFLFGPDSKNINGISLDAH